MGYILGLYGGYIVIMERKMETTIQYILSSCHAVNGSVCLGFDAGLIQMSHSLNGLEGGSIYGIIWGTILGLFRGILRVYLDYSSYGTLCLKSQGSRLLSAIWVGNSY